MQSPPELIAWNAQGLIPGPEESEKQFRLRAEEAKSSLAGNSFSRLQKLYDADPQWVKIDGKTKGLLPWEAAAAWIEDSRVTIQARPKLWIDRDEILSHELVHAMRLKFEEPRFEEILAYRVCKNRLRRYLGPIFARPTHAKAFVILLALSFLQYWIPLYFDLKVEWVSLMTTPFLYLGWLLFRLIQSQRIFTKCLEQLARAARDPDKALAVAMRLSDAEIAQFSCSSPNEIKAFAEKQNCLRWAQLRHCYFH